MDTKAEINDFSERHTITITISNSQWQRLKEMADRFGLNVEDLVQAKIEELEEGRFKTAADYVVSKNEELYKRLAYCAIYF